MQVPDLEENLLEGVVLTNSISCPNPDLSGQFTIDAFEGLSLTAELDEEFKLSSNEEDNERGVLHDISHDQSSFDINLLTQTKKVGTGRHRVNPGRSSVMKAKRPARVRDRQCEKILNLDTKLVEMYCSGLLDENGAVGKIGQLILTEQYCKLKTYENKFLQTLKEVDFTLLQFQKQKKSMMNQISLLKADNQALRATIDELHQIIKELQVSIEEYFLSSQQDKLPLVYSTSPSNNQSDRRASSFESKYVNHAAEESKLLSVLQESKQGKVQSLSLQDFAEFVLQVKNRTSNLLRGSEDLEDAKLYIPIIDRFSKDSTVRDWIVEIITNLHQLQQQSSFSCFTFAGSDLKQPSRSRPIQRFLSIITANRAKFKTSNHLPIQEVQESNDKQLQFWFIVHSTLTTFIGILMNEPNETQEERTFAGLVATWTTQMHDQLCSLRELCSVRLCPERERYWHKLLGLIRMLRSRQ